MIRPLRETMREYRAKVMLDAVLQYNGDICKAARALGIHRNLIYYHLRSFGPAITSVKLRRVQSLLKFTAQKHQHKH